MFENGINALLDANINRAKEGLRVLEDTARFVLADDELMNKVRPIRHALADFFPEFEKLKQLESRHAGSDIGQKHDVPDRKTLRNLVMANARRVQEALRVLEEYETSANQLKDLRYQLYEIETLFLRKLRLYPFNVNTVYVISDEVAPLEEGLKQGAKLIQLRDKKSTPAQILEKAKVIKKLADQYEATFIVNDYPEVAVACDADGLHLGQEDMATAEARKILKPGQILGRTTHELSQAKLALAEKADYISCGPIHATPTKPNRKPVGLEYLKQLQTEIKMPVVVIGGLDLNNVDEVLTAGPHTIGIVRDYVKTAEILLKIKKAGMHVKA
jgi:thiamine-phosphate pyrophosphorylase